MSLTDALLKLDLGSARAYIVSQNDEIDRLRAEVAALREAGEGLASEADGFAGIRTHYLNAALTRWREVASSGAIADKQECIAPDSTETLAGVPVEDLYKGLSYE